MKKPDNTMYELATIRLLGGFQLLEEALKVYISVAYELIQDCLNIKIPFNYSSTDIENYPLERLLSIFAKLSKNEELYSRLNKLREVRNHVAHQSLVAIIGSDENIINDKLNNFLDHNNKVIDCLGLLIVEIKALDNNYKAS